MRGAQVRDTGRTEQVCDGIDPEERREEGRDGGQVRGVGGERRGHTVSDESAVEVGRERVGETHDQEGEEESDREHLRGVLERGVHARPGTAVLGGE